MYRTGAVNHPDYPEIKQIVDRHRRIIAVNLGAAKDAKVILLLPPGRTIRCLVTQSRERK